MSAVPCFHCHEPVTDAAGLCALVRGRQQPVCCRGCQAAAEWIDTLGLADYYRLRTEPAARSTATADYLAWDRPQLQRLHVRRSASDRAEVVVLVEGLRCPACAWLIERGMNDVTGVREVRINAIARRVSLVFDPTLTTLSVLLTALARLGYPPHPLSEDSINAQRQRESRDALKRLAVAGLGAMQAMMVAVALYAGVFDGIDPAVREFFRWLGVLVATPVVVYSARPFFAGAWREWRSWRVSMDTPVALAIGLIYMASVYGVLRGGQEIYFDSVSMFVLFLLLGRHLAMRARHRSGDLVDALSRLQPALAERRGSDGYTTVAVHELEPGDVVRVASGSVIPADGQLLGPVCRVDESLVSGESTPAQREPGQALIAGSLLLDGPVEITVRHIGADTVLAGIVRLVSRAAAERPALAHLADARAARFVLTVLTLTVVTGLAWAWVDPARALPAALAVLVVSCPCAFALAVPSALARAVAVLAQRGVLVLQPDALEALAGANYFVFDKTGTLSEPGIDVEHVQLFRGSLDSALGIAASLEQGSTHPLAGSLRSAAHGCELRRVEQSVHSAGAGVAGAIDGVQYRLGRQDFALGFKCREPVISTGWRADESGTARIGNPLENSLSDDLILADDNGEIARFPIREIPRTGAANLIGTLQAAGAVCEMLSGDSPLRVSRLAARLGITQWIASAGPADKLDRLRTLRSRGQRVAMVGDGINDAPVLAGADVAITVAHGAALAHAASAILLASPRIDGLIAARDVARDMLQRMRQNLHWALIYNIAAVPLAGFGLVPPWLAAIGMSTSSLVVVLNSMRIGRCITDDAPDRLQTPVSNAPRIPTGTPA